MPLHIAIDVSIHTVMHMSIHMSTHMSIHMSIQMSIHMSIHVSTHMSIRRYFRVLQTGPNSSGSHRLMCAGIELYVALIVMACVVAARAHVCRYRAVRGRDCYGHN